MKETKIPTGAPPGIPPRIVWIFLALALLLDVGVRLRLLNFPLERDEGEYAYAGQLILEGIPPYKLASNMKLPGAYLAYAAGMAVFGQTPAGIHLTLIVVNLATLLLLFVVAREFLDLPEAAITTAAYALMTISPAYLGLAAHATHFVIFAALLGVWMLLKLEKNPRLSRHLWAGLFFGLAFVMKQQGVFFGIFGGLYVVWLNISGKTARPQLLARIGLYSLGCLLPYLGVCAWLACAGVFPQFWFWTVSYARAYETLATPGQALKYLGASLSSLFCAAPLLWIIAGFGLVCLWLSKRTANERVFLAGFGLFSLMAVCPGWYFRPHYFIVLAPAVALLVGLAVSWTARRIARKRRLSAWPWLGKAPFYFAALACLTSVFSDFEIFFLLNPTEASRAIYGANPFPEAVEISRHIKENTRADDPIFVLGSEPEIYFYSHRHSSTAQIYMYSLVEQQAYAGRMREEMVREIEKAPPAFLVAVFYRDSWMVASHNSFQTLADWAKDFANARMHCTGLVQLYDDKDSDYTWGNGAENAALTSTNYIFVYQRNSAK